MTKPSATWAAIALGHMGPKAEQAVPVLSATLKDRRHGRGHGVGVGLGQIGLDAKDAVPALTEAVQGDNPGMRSGPPSRWCSTARRAGRQPRS